MTKATDGEGEVRRAIAARQMATLLGRVSLPWSAFWAWVGHGGFWEEE